MPKLSTTKPNVFIVESLTLRDEGKDHYEGKLISGILKMSCIDHRYYYIRTEREFQQLLKEFKKLNYRYLHISCHGTASALSTTFDPLPFGKLGTILENELHKRRLFLSACLCTNDSLANALFKKSGCNSIIGPNETVHFDDAAIFWASFYQLMFKQNNSVWKKDALTDTISRLKSLHQIPLKYYTKSNNIDRGWKEVKLK